MKLFFGKIKHTTDNNQINGAYYQTLSPMKLGELQEGNYAFIISGKSIHLWKATRRVEIDGHSKMNFEVIHNNLPMNSSRFIAFRYFQLDSSLIVLSIRQSPKAFYPIQFETSFTEEMLLDENIYTQEENFRKINILPSEKDVVTNSKDIQLYFDKNKHLQIVKAPYFDQSLFDNFIDNMSQQGNGRRMKDNALIKIRKGMDGATTYTYDQLSILRMYDALFNEYGAPDELEIEKLEDETSQEEPVSQPSTELKSFNQIYYGPPGTGKTYLVRQSFCIEEEIIDKAQDRIKLYLSRSFYHMAPGRNAYLWDELKKGNRLGYEWVDKSWGDLDKLTQKDIDNEGWGNYQLITYLKHVNKGDYICVISGKRLLGIAEVTSIYKYEEAIENDLAFQTIPVKWLKQFDKPIYLNSSQTKTFVKINGGTRWNTLLALLRENGFYFDGDKIEDSKVVKPKNFTFVTFHQSFSYEDFVEGIKPIMADSQEENGEEISANLNYEIVPGIFYEACEKAAQLAGYKTLQDCLLDSRFSRQKKFQGVQEYYLIIDELNRGNVASIFGELITLIEEDKRLGTDLEIITDLPYSKSKFGVPANLRIVGTMNTADRSIEALDTALRRRFSFQESLPKPRLLNTETEELNINLRRLLETINERLEKLLNRDHTIGHSFLMRVTGVKDLKNVFCNKIIPLLQEYFYNDYAKIGLVIGEDFLNIKKSPTSFMKVGDYDASDMEDRTVYSLKNLDILDEPSFLNMVRKVYGS